MPIIETINLSSLNKVLLPRSSTYGKYAPQRQPIPNIFGKLFDSNTPSKGVVVAGGYATYLATGFSAGKPLYMDDETEPIAKDDFDIDIFPYGLDEFEATHILATFSKDCRVTRKNQVFEWTKNSLKFQFIMNSYANIDAIFDSFDLSCCQVAFDKNNMYFSAEGKQAIDSGIININWNKRSSKNQQIFDNRLAKYINRGFGVSGCNISITDSKITISSNTGYEIIIEAAITSSFDGNNYKITAGQINHTNSGDKTRVKNYYQVFKSSYSEETLQNMFDTFYAYDFIDELKEIVTVDKTNMSQILTIIQRYTQPSEEHLEENITTFYAECVESQNLIELTYEDFCKYYISKYNFSILPSPTMFYDMLNKVKISYNRKADEKTVTSKSDEEDIEAPNSDCESDSDCDTVSPKFIRQIAKTLKKAYKVKNVKRRCKAKK